MLLLQASCSPQWSSSFAPSALVFKSQNSRHSPFEKLICTIVRLALEQKTRLGNRKALPAAVERALLQVRSEQQPQGTTNSAHNKSWCWFPCLLTQSPFSCARFFYMSLTWMQTSNWAIDSGGFSSLCKRCKYSVAIQKDLGKSYHDRASPHPPLFVLASSRTC